MLDLMMSEDELANVLATRSSTSTTITASSACRWSETERSQPRHLGSALADPLDFWEAGYHKDEEFEADREGMYLAVQSGYSPYGAVDTFERFAKLCDEYVIHAQSPDQELSELAIQSLRGYFRSHPLPSERLAQANRIIAEQHWEDRKTQKPFRIEYEVHNGEYVE